MLEICNVGITGVKWSIVEYNGIRWDMIQSYRAELHGDLYQRIILMLLEIFRLCSRLSFVMVFNMSEEPKTPRKIKPKSRENVIIADLGADLTPRIRTMALKNGISVSQALRLLVRKSLMSAKNDRVITLTIPEEALIQP